MRRRQPKEPTCKVLTFALGDLHLALKVDAVQRVLRLPQIYKTPSAPLGIAMVGEAEVLVLDLYHNLFQQEMPSDRQHKRYFVTIKHDDTLYGIPTLEMPALQDIPLSALKPTPTQYRAHDPLGVASHVFHSNQKTYFLLDPQSLWQALVNQQNIREAMMQVVNGEQEDIVDTLPDFLDDFADSEPVKEVTPPEDLETVDTLPDFLDDFADSEPVKEVTPPEDLEKFDTLPDFLDDFADTEPAIALRQNQSLEVSEADDLGITIETVDNNSPIRNFDDLYDDTLPDLRASTSSTADEIN